MLLIFIFTVLNLFLCSDISSCALFWDDELLVTMAVASLLVSSFSVDISLIVVCSFHGFIPTTATYGIYLVAACMAIFFKKCMLLHQARSINC